MDEIFWHLIDFLTIGKLKELKRDYFAFFSYQIAFIALAAD
jgi:hypothetical protein